MQVQVNAADGPHQTLVAGRLGQRFVELLIFGRKISVLLWNLILNSFPGDAQVGPDLGRHTISGQLADHKQFQRQAHIVILKDRILYDQNCKTYIKHLSY